MGRQGCSQVFSLLGRRELREREPMQQYLGRGCDLWPHTFHLPCLWGFGEASSSSSWDKALALHLYSNVWHKEVLHCWSIIPVIICNQIKAMIETLWWWLVWSILSMSSLCTWLEGYRLLIFFFIFFLIWAISQKISELALNQCGGWSGIYWV